MELNLLIRINSELACRLYYELLDQSHTWSKNQWYLNDRLVESPHTTAFYARSPAETKSKEMEEARRYWCVSEQTTKSKD